LKVMTSDEWQVVCVWSFGHRDEILICQSRQTCLQQLSLSISGSERSEITDEFTD